jgi:hypothetical protein
VAKNDTSNLEIAVVGHDDYGKPLGFRMFTREDQLKACSYATTLSNGLVWSKAELKARWRFIFGDKHPIPGELG